MSSELEEKLDLIGREIEATNRLLRILIAESRWSNAVELHLQARTGNWNAADQNAVVEIMRSRGGPDSGL